jgi:Uma2 family endonuclease
MASTLTLMTAEEFCQMPDDGQLSELIRGKIVPMNMPSPRHGQVCLAVGSILLGFVKPRNLGSVACNDSGIITERSPDTVRGADVCFYSHARVPDRRLPATYPAVAPDLVVEVLSPSDRWSEVLTKIGEYMTAGVRVVVVLDPEDETAELFYPDRRRSKLSVDEDLSLPDVLPGFVVKVRELFG